MSHAHIALLDNSIRGAWFAQGPYALSTALRTSASLGTASRKEQRDSSSPRNVRGDVGLSSGSEGTIVRGLWWIRNVK